jgi:molybdopterin converting factor subunit 1
MTVRVQLFAVAKQLAGHEALDIEIPDGGTVGHLRSALAAQIPALTDALPRMMFAVNQEYATNETFIPPGAEVACIPPVSGG